MATPVFNSWTFIWTLIAFLLILAGTSINDWTSTNQKYNDFYAITPAGVVVDTQPPNGTVNEFLFRGATIYGTLAARYDFITGYNYATICDDGNTKDSKKNHTKHHKNDGQKHSGNGHHHNGHEQVIPRRAKEINEVSAGMIAMLLLTNTICFFASFTAVLGCTRSSIGGDLATARVLAISAFITSLITWALWLRAHQEFLLPKHNACRFPGFEHIKHVTLGPAWGLFIIGSVLYLVLMVQVSRIVRLNTAAGTNAGVVTPAPMSQGWLIFIAVLAFAVIFTGSIDNHWSRAGSNHFELSLEKEINDFIGSFHRRTPVRLDYDYDYDYASNNNNANAADDDYDFVGNTTSPKGVSRVTYEEEFGVFTAFQFLEISLTYSDPSNRRVICPENTDKDGANVGLVQGGMVTLGFAIAATILSFFAAWLQMGDNRNGFWLSTLALMCVAVSLIVWSSTSDYVIRDRCCADDYCSLSESYGLLAAGGVFLIIAMFYQAWVLQAEIYVLPAHAYGMANQFETELQTV